MAARATGGACSVNAAGGAEFPLRFRNFARKKEAKGAPMLAIAAAALLLAIPTPEAEALGRRLAATGALETLLPAVAAKETEDLIAQHPELSEAERQTLRATGREVAATLRDRLVDAFGPEYAATLSVEDLRALVAFAESPAARHYRDAEPGVLTRAAPKLGGIDFGGTLRKSFCAKTGKLCPK